MPEAGRALVFALTSALLLLAAVPAKAGHHFSPRQPPFFVIQEPLDLAPLPDLLQIIVRDRELLAIDNFATSILREALHVGEEVEWTGSRGRVAVVITNRRVLAATTTSSNWSSTDIRLAESAPETAFLGERVALLLTDQRAIGFEGMSGTLVESELSPREEVLHAAVDRNVAVVVTHRRAFGIAAFGGGFFETEIGPREDVDAVSTRADFATVATRHQLLVFRAPSATWQRRDLSLR